MHYQPGTTAKDFELAEHKYLSPDELGYRLEVASAIRAQAWLNHSDWILPPWEKMQKRQQMLKRQADRYETCRLQYTRLGCKDCGTQFVGPRRCEVRICDHCAKKYAIALRRRQTKFAKRLYAHKDGRRPMFVTFTLSRHPLYEPSNSDVDRIFRAFKKLMHRVWPTSNGCGALAVLEVGSNFHLHVHAIVYGHFVPCDELSNLWEKLTGDSKIVHIREIRKPAGCVNYILKYITKPDSKRDPKRTAKWLALLIGQRRVRTYGIFYGKAKLFAPKVGCPCPRCNGKLRFIDYHDGKALPASTMLLAEAFKLKPLETKF